VTALQQDLARPTRWPALDGYRGLAVLVVVGYHAVRLVLESHDLVHADHAPLALWPLALGKFSVDAFFVLSGFLIVTAWDRRPEWRPFLTRRVRRLFPAYLVSVAILVPLVAPQVLGSWKDLFLLATLQGYVADHLTSAVNVPLWSLTTEVHFYLLVPLLAPLLHRRFGRWGLLAAACALSVWWWDRGAESMDLSASLLPGRLPQFLVGALVGIAVRERGADSWAWIVARSRLVARAAVVALVLLGLYLGANGTYHRRGVAFDLWIEPLSGLLLAVLLLHVVTRPPTTTTVLAGPTLRGAGLVSYSLYLWHYPILAASVAWFDVGTAPLMAVPAVLLGLAVTAAVTAVSYRWIERPLLYGRATAQEPAPQAGTRRTPATVGSREAGALA
jgi:peptidoglycan/LPS O-acetylase OafA/YrhL